MRSDRNFEDAMLALDTPDDLKKTLWGSKTVIQLRVINDAMVAAVRRVTPHHLTRRGQQNNSDRGKSCGRESWLGAGHRGGRRRYSIRHGV